MGHLDSQLSLPVLGSEKSGFSPVSKKLRLAAEHKVVVLNAPTAIWPSCGPARPTCAQPSSSTRPTTSCSFS
jgi:hypothetical protein